MPGEEDENRKVFRRWRKVDKDGARSRDYIVRQTVPDGWSDNWEGPAANGRQLHGRHQQTIGPSREEETPTRYIGDKNQLTQVCRRSIMSSLVHEHGHLEPYSQWAGSHIEGDQCGRLWRCGLSDAGCKPCCRVQNRLKSTKKRYNVCRKTDQNDVFIYIVQARSVWNAVVMRTHVQKHRFPFIFPITRSASTEIPRSRTDWTGLVGVPSTSGGDLHGQLVHTAELQLCQDSAAVCSTASNWLYKALAGRD